MTTSAYSVGCMDLLGECHRCLDQLGTACSCETWSIENGVATGVKCHADVLFIHDAVDVRRELKVPHYYVFDGAVYDSSCFDSIRANAE